MSENRWELNVKINESIITSIIMLSSITYHLPDGESEKRPSYFQIAKYFNLRKKGEVSSKLQLHI